MLRKILSMARQHGRWAIACVAVAAAWLISPAIAAPTNPPAPAASPAPAPSKSAWAVLVQPNKRWVLHDTFEKDRDRVIVVETYDVHQVGGATVGRLRWTAKENERAKEGDPIGSQDGPCYTRLAVNDRGLYILRDDMDDAAVAAAVQGRPSRSDPPRPYKGTKKNGGRYLAVHAQKDGSSVICVGDGPLPDAGECEDVCFAEMCFSPTKGVVQVSGTAAPDYGTFAPLGFKLDI